MDNETRIYINNIANLVRNIYDIKTPIKDINAIVKKLGGEIVEKRDFDDFCDGTIQKSGDNSFVIAISPYQNERRKNFTVAHELGHLFLHMGYLTNKEVWDKQETIYTRFGSSEQEYQANEFAAALLMPAEQYKEYLDKNSYAGKVDLSKLANEFNVSLSAAINRGLFLGFIA